MRILIIDPVQINVDFLRKELEGRFPGVEIVVASAARTGLFQALDETFDAVLVADYSNVPGIQSEGFFLANLIRREKAYPSDAEIVLMTSLPRDEVRRHFFPDNLLACPTYEAPRDLFRRLKRRGRENPRPTRRGY